MAKRKGDSYHGGSTIVHMQPETGRRVSKAATEIMMTDKYPGIVWAAPGKPGLISKKGKNANRT